MTSAPRGVNKWIVTVTVMLPTIMEIVDTSVANVALPNMQGSLNAGTDEVTWVLTSYLVANAIILPITGWLARVFGRKRFLLTCIILFTVASYLC
jgi:DHA2 family multidrug resistance protein